MEQNKKQPRKGWQIYFTAIVSALLGVLLSCLILPVVLYGYWADNGLTPGTTSPPYDINIKYDNPVPLVYNACNNSVVLVTTYLNEANTTPGQESVKSAGSGVILTADGYIGTCGHLINGAAVVKVTLPDGTRMTAQVIGVDPSTDLALLRVRKSGLKPIQYGSSDELLVGDLVVLIGNPYGTHLTNTMTAGYVSALRREIVIDGNISEMIQTDAAVNPGNSGGGMFNKDGELVGLVMMKNRVSGYDSKGQEIISDGIGFALPATTAKDVFDQLIAAGSIPRPAIGIQMELVDAQAAALAGVPAGVTITAVTPDSPAKEAGLRVGDVILYVDDVACTTPDMLRDAIQNKKVEDTIALVILREETEHLIEVTIGDLSDFPQED